jgi:hypothetical protein
MSWPSSSAWREEDHAAALRVTTTARGAAVSPRPSKSWTATRSGRHGSSSNCPVRPTPRWRRRRTMREPAGAPAGTERRDEGTRASAPAHNAGSARGSLCTHHSSARFLFLETTNFCAIVCLPADRNTHACPTQTCVRGIKLTRRGVSRSAAVAIVPPQQNKHDLIAFLRTTSSPVLDERLLFGIAAIRSVVTTSEALGQLCFACFGPTLSSLGHPQHHWRNTDLLGPEVGAAYSPSVPSHPDVDPPLPQHHRLADDQPAAARHESSEHRLLSSKD